VLAEAVQTLWPGTQVTIGPVIDSGFYYDFYRNQPFTPEDFPAIEKKMREIIARDNHSPRKCGRATRPSACSATRASVQGRAGRRHSRRPGYQDLQAGRLVRSLPRPAHDLDRQGRRCLQADEGGGAYWRGDSSREMLSRIYGTAFAKQEELDAYLQADRGGGEARPSQARPRDGSFPLPGGSAGLGVLAPEGLDLFQTLENYIRRRADRRPAYAEVTRRSSSIPRYGSLRTHGDLPRSMFLCQPRERTSAPSYQADELPRHSPDLQERAQILPRPAVQGPPSFGKVHRFEPSGALHGLMRVRAFTQDDAHVFITEEQIADESLKMNDLILSIYEDFGFADVQHQVLRPPEKRIGDDAVWDKARRR
jgi:threonyl-tRNA synthetase